MSAAPATPARRRPARVAVALCAAVLAGAPGAHPTAREPIPAHPGMLRFVEPRFDPPAVADHRHPAARGAVVFLAEDHTLPLVQVAVALRVGSFLDPDGRTGLASLTGSLLRRGGAGELPADAFDERVDFLGARLDSFTGTTRGGASLDTPSWALEEALDLLFAMLARPHFDADRIEAAKRNVFDNLGRRNEDPLELLEREWEWLLFGEDHFSTRPVTGATLAAIGREEMLAFHRRYWRPRNLIFAVSGDVEAERLLALIDRHLAAWPEAAAEPPAWPPPPPDHRPRPGPYVIEKDVPQAKVLLGHLARAGDLAGDGEPWGGSEAAALRVMNEILGGSGAISRIAGRLRTAEGLVYRASASFDLGALWPGDFRVFFDTANRSVGRAAALALEEIQRLRSREVHPQELAVAKESLLAGLRQSFDSAEEIAGYLAEDELLGRSSDRWRPLYDAIRAVTAAEVLAVAKRYLRPSDVVLLAVGRGAEIAAGSDPPALERLTGRKLVRLPLRDPVTMEEPP